MFSFFKKNQAKEDKILFTVPDPAPFENPVVVIQPSELRQWAASLPFANLQQLAEEIGLSLSKLNRYPGAVKKRAELMEIYRTPVGRFLHQPLDRKADAPIPMARALMLEMGYGYLHLVNACLQKNAHGRHKRDLLDYLYHATKYLGMEQFFAAREYDCRANYIRRELTRVHTLAEEHHLENEPVDDPEQSNPTISHLYKKGLLLNLLDPCHLQVGEVESINDYLDDMTGEAEFQPLNGADNKGGLYIFDRLGEVPPYFYVAEDAVKLTPPRFCLFSIKQISQQLHQDLRNLERPNGLTPEKLRHLPRKTVDNLIRRMLKSWHIRLRRDSERHSTSGQALLLFGIQRIHQELTNNKPKNMQAKEAEENITLNREATGLGHQEQSQQRISGWRFNQSLYGVALHLPLPIACPPKIGELVLIQNPASTGAESAKFGIIRRALKQEGQLLEIGVQFLNGKVVPLTIQPKIEKQEEEQEPVSLPAFYIDLGGIERSVLIIGRDQLSIGQECRVEEMIPAPTIVPIQLLEITASYEKFRVIRV